MQPILIKHGDFIKLFSSTFLVLSASATTSRAIATTVCCALAPTTAPACAASANALLAGLANLVSARPQVTPAFRLVVEKSALARALASAEFASVLKTPNREDPRADTARSAP